MQKMSKVMGGPMSKEASAEKEKIDGRLAEVRSKISELDNAQPGGFEEDADS